MRCRDETILRVYGLAFWYWTKPSPGEAGAVRRLQPHKNNGVEHRLASK